MKKSHKKCMKVLKEILDYNPKTGQFIWRMRTSKAIKIGDIAGCINKSGYVVIRLLGRLHYAHRLAFFIVHGYYPLCIDHINKNKSDNRIANLRDVSYLENNLNKNLLKNNKTGVAGVSYYKKYDAYVAYIWYKNKKKTLGYKKTLLEATILRRDAEYKLYGRYLYGGS